MRRKLPFTYYSPKVGVWSLFALALLMVFLLGRYSMHVSPALYNTTPVVAVGVGSAKGVIRSPQDNHAGPSTQQQDASSNVADTAAGCNNPLEMYDNEGVDDEDNPNSKRRHNTEEEEYGVFDGTRHFVDKCITQGSERLEIVSRSKLKGNDKKKEIVDFGEAVAFLVRDVCALGHFPKDLSHMHSWQQLMSSAARDGVSPADRMREIVVAGEDDAKKRAALLKKAPQWMEHLEGGAIHHLVVGHRCATRDPARSFNKRTPVFHNVLVHWLRAISGNFKFLTPEDDGGKTTMPITLFEDLDSKVYCFRHMIEREERWRWFPHPRSASSFREAFWKYLNVNYTQRHAERHTTAFSKQKKLQVLVLHRDEDRHFDEKRVVQFLTTKFGGVADIRYEQYDAPPNPAKITAENNVTVPLHVDQLKQLYNTDILIAAHGAALSNVVVMQPGAVVMELFPHNFRYYMYEELCRVMSLNYVAYESEVVTPAGCCKQVRWKATAGELAGAGGEEKDADDVNDPLDSDASSIRKKEMVRLNGKRDCKKCSIGVKDETWYQLVKSAMASIWLRNSRLSNVHDFMCGVKRLLAVLLTFWKPCIFCSYRLLFCLFLRHSLSLSLLASGCAFTPPACRFSTPSDDPTVLFSAAVDRLSDEMKTNFGRLGTQMSAFDAKMNALDAKLDALGASVKAEMEDVKNSIRSDTQSWLKTNERFIRVCWVALFVALVYAAQCEAKMARAFERSQTTSVVAGAMQRPARQN
ncbi:transmembrane protein, putative [Bodo saltans]|uniref:Transmembrane protein, putative n=1 Tax=Bodo saltans TaxID=75058 RepID=A0A0S4JNK1_BODSA|nr:transmembrane protein, putative [Bodo saltans]|eukprot:CUG91710.1 transmembrane protein, putative [Bodo saltans]